jgi:hypothetical protein
LDHEQSINKFTSEDRWFSAIGRFIYEFSQLEFTLKYYVAEAIGLNDQHFNTIVSQFDFARLCDVAESVLLQPRTDLPLSIEGDLGEPPASHQQIFQQVIAEHKAEKRERTKRLKELIKECKSLNNDRIRVVHGLWTIAGEPRELNYVSRQSFNNSSHFRDPAELAKKADQAAHLRNEISCWLPAVARSFAAPHAQRTT